MRKIIYIIMFLLLSVHAFGHDYSSNYLVIRSAIDTLSDLDFETHLAKCSKYNRTPFYNVCLAPHYKRLLSNMSASDVLFLAENQVTHNLSSDCHFIGHEIGSEVYHKNKEIIADSIKECGDIWLCGGGCHHQIFIEFMDNKSVAEITKARDDVCSRQNNSLPDDFEYTCHHSFGHSMALYFEYDLDKAKLYCNISDNEYKY